MWQKPNVMGDVINLNRFRKKKAREEKARRAETNRRLHGRTKAERARDEAQKKHLEDKLNGAFLVRERVQVEDLPPDLALAALEKAVEGAVPIEELGSRASVPEEGSEDPSSK